MKKTLIAEAPVRNQIFKAQAPKDNEFAKDEREMRVGTNLQFGADLDEAVPIRNVEGSVRNKLQESPDQTIISS